MTPETPLMTYEEKRAARVAYLDLQASSRRWEPNTRHRWGLFVKKADRWEQPIFFRSRKAAEHYAQETLHTRQYIVGRY